MAILTQQSLSGGGSTTVSRGGLNSAFDYTRRVGKMWQLDPSNTPITAFGATAPTGTGTRTVFSDATGSYVNHATTTSVGNAVGWTDAERYIAQRQHLPYIVYTIKTGANTSDITDVRINVGAVSNTVGGTDTPTGNFALFKYYTTTSDTTWKTMTRDNVTTETKDSGITVAANTRYTLAIDMTTSGSIKFYINDTLVTTHTANLPSASAALLTVALIENRNVASARNIRIAGMTFDSL